MWLVSGGLDVFIGMGCRGWAEQIFTWLSGACFFQFGFIFIFAAFCPDAAAVLPNHCFHVSYADCRVGFCLSAPLLCQYVCRCHGEWWHTLFTRHCEVDYALFFSKNLKNSSNFTGWLIKKLPFISLFDINLALFSRNCFLRQKLP